MEVLKVILTIVLVLVSIGLIVVVLMQEGKNAGLGSLAGGAGENSYVAQNKGRTREGKLAKYTKIMVAAFMILALLLNIL